MATPHSNSTAWVLVESGTVRGATATNRTLNGVSTLHIVPPRPTRLKPPNTANRAGSHNSNAAASAGSMKDDLGVGLKNPPRKSGHTAPPWRVSRCVIAKYPTPVGETLR